MLILGSRGYRRAVSALCLGSVLVFANLYAIQPLLPTLAAEFELTALQASYSFSITTLTLGLSLLVYGGLSDALGRKPLMIGSLIGVVLTIVMLSQVRSYIDLMILRAVLGLFLGGLPAIAIAYMGDEFERPALIVAVGFYISANTVGGISGRLIGGFVGEWLGWSAVFMVMAGFSALLLALFVVLLPNAQRFSARPIHLGQILSDLYGHLRNPLILMACLIGGFNFFIFINQYSYVTFLLAAPPYNLSSSWLGLLFLTYLTGTFGSAISGRVAQRIPQPLCMVLGIGILILGSVTTLLPSLAGIVAGFFISAFGLFFTQATASSWVSQQALQAKASASALYLLSYYLGATAGGFYLYPFWHWAAWQGVIIGSIIVLLGTLSCAILLFMKTHRRVVT
ncbi:MFS transporter [Salinispirillum sp. LH 10-3-1]|uniref:MFS transporter n=1 Tax=Salinispirillum sp. LH 10-3-1 TaxID=2952525 RepID=A0AB38YCM2_9GAMM